MNDKVLVTGSAGFIGSWVCTALRARGYAVAGLDSRHHAPAAEIDKELHCDLLDQGALLRHVKEWQPRFLIHLAARTDLREKTDLAGYEANIGGVRNLLHAIRATGSITRAVFTSSQLVNRIGHVPSSMDEYSPSTLYGQSKVLTERIVKETAGGGVDWCLVRPTTVWGPGMSRHYQTFLALILKRRYFHCGRARLLKSYSYVANIAAQYSALLVAPASSIHGRTLYLADYEPISLREYADDLASQMGARPIPTIPLPLARLLGRFGDIAELLTGRHMPLNSFRLNNILTEYVFDLKPTERICGPLPTNYAAGIRETARWFLELKGRQSC